MPFFVKHRCEHWRVSGTVLTSPSAHAVHFATALALVAFGCESSADPSPLRQLTNIPGNESQITFSPLGSFIAFASDQRGDLDVKIVDVATQNISDIAATAANESEPQWSPNGAQIAFTAAEDGRSIIRISSLDGSQVGQITDNGDNASRARWSPNGEWIAFVSRGTYGAQTWMVRPDGTNKQQLTFPPSDHFPYGWSPDGQYVLVIQFAEAAQNIFGIPISGGEPLQITNRQGEEWWPQWSPQGDRVAFYSTWGDEMTEIWTADVNTQSLTQITNLPVEDFRPAWSPDGQWLAYSSDRSSKSGVWVSSADGTNAIALATDGRAGELHTWSPDGRWVAFSYLTTKEHLYTIAVGDTAAVPLMDGARNIVEAAVSPDERFIAFESDDVGSEADLFLFEIETGVTTRLTQEIAYNARPSWSPDGNHLTFERSLGGGPRTTHVGVMDLSTRSINVLTDHGYVRQPVWCGEHIVYLREQSQESGGIDQLWSVPAAGGTPIQLTSTAGHKRPTDCSRRGRMLYTIDNGTGKILWQAMISTNGTMTDNVMVGKGEGGRWAADESRIAFLSNKDGTPDVYIVAENGGDVVRITNSAVRESWPNWLGDRIVYGANVGGRDIWMADFHTILAKSAT